MNQSAAPPLVLQNTVKTVYFTVQNILTLYVQYTLYCRYICTVLYIYSTKIHYIQYSKYCTVLLTSSLLKPSLPEGARRVEPKK